MSPEHFPLTIRLLCLSLFSLFVVSCAGSGHGVGQPPGLDLSGPDAAFARPAEPIPTPDELHRLTAAQQAEFLAYFHHPERSSIPAHRRVSDYMQDATQDMRYELVTLQASSVLEELRGNCLSLAMLTTALAELAGVRIGYQLMDDDPIYEITGDLVSKGVHVRTVLYQSDSSGPYAGRALSRPHILVDYFSTQRERFISNLSVEAYQAMYYRNIAAEALLAADHGKAWWYAREALALDPLASETLNMLAVILSRTDQMAEAETVFRYGIAHAWENLSLLKNYHHLLVAQHRSEEAEQIRKRLATMNDPSPIHWFQLARSYEEEGDPAAAIPHYRKALRLAPYLHEAYSGLARAYTALGDLEQAEEALSQALARAERSSTRDRYEQALGALDQFHGAP